MSKYGISTQVVNTYVADFHGTTVTLFEKISPDQITNKPVCFDCHGVHNIKKVDDPVYGLAMKQKPVEGLPALPPKCEPQLPGRLDESLYSQPYRRCAGLLCETFL